MLRWSKELPPNTLIRLKLKGKLHTELFFEGNGRDEPISLWNRKQNAENSACYGGAEGAP